MDIELAEAIRANGITPAQAEQNARDIAELARQTSWTAAELGWE